jgi:hypothetical protein
LEDPSFLNKIRECWRQIDPLASKCPPLQFQKNLKREKSTTSSREKKKRKRDKKDLVEIESQLQENLDSDGMGYTSNQQRLYKKSGGTSKENSSRLRTRMKD